MNQKSSWTGASTKKLLQSEQKLLKLIDIENYQLGFAPVDGEEEKQFIHFLRIGEVGEHNPQEGKPKMVLIHGFGGGCLILFRVLKTLSEFFEIYAIDLLGMGGPKWTAKTPEDAEAFFVDSLHEFTKFIGWDKFILAGHSFGGFISGHYAAKYPHKIEHLLLLSPAGVGELKENETGLERFEKRFAGSWKGRLALRTMKYCWRKNITPFAVARKFGRLSSTLFKGFVKRRFKANSMSKEEKNELAEYLYQCNMLKGSGEFGLMTAFKAGLWAHNCLKKMLTETEFDKPTTFVYGYEDWMDPADAYKIQEHLMERNIYCKIELVPEAGHHLYLDNPEGLLGAMMGVIFGDQDAPAHPAAMPQAMNEFINLEEIPA